MTFFECTKAKNHKRVTDAICLKCKEEDCEKKKEINMQEQEKEMTPLPPFKVEDKRQEFPVEKAPEPSSDIMIAALNRGLSLADIEKMMELRAKHEAYEAKKAYVEAMAAFKADPPIIEKDRHVSYKTDKGQVEYDHASLANVTKNINAGLGKHGLSAAWITVQNEKDITVTCTITHKQGHSESTSLTAAPDNSGSKNAIQAVGSTISYLERYTLLALTGLATADMDDDGQGTEEQEYIIPEQVKTITDLLAETKMNLQGFLKFVNAENVESILASNYKKGIELLNTRKGAK